MILLGSFIWFNTFTFHDNGDGPTFISAETMLNRNRRGQANEHLLHSIGRVVMSGMEQVKEEQVHHKFLKL